MPISITATLNHLRQKRRKSQLRLSTSAPPLWSLGNMDFTEFDPAKDWVKSIVDQLSVPDDKYLGLNELFDPALVEFYVESSEPAANSKPSSSPGGDATEPLDRLRNLVLAVEFHRSPAKTDVFWHGVFTVAEERQWLRKARGICNAWAELYLNGVPSDMHPRMLTGIAGAPRDDEWVAASLAAGRLYSLGYGYSSYSWDKLMQGLGDRANCDSMRLGSCVQLLAGGQKIKQWIYGTGPVCEPGKFAGWLQKPEKPFGEAFWQSILDNLETQQVHALSPQVSELLKATREHLMNDGPDLTSEQVTEIIWPKQLLEELKEVPEVPDESPNRSSDATESPSRPASPT
ncbi:hypothetical protein CC1G_06948 [Coprinopsis cinerea okayama7|uniref:Uncharacterized protein n=1 Tax=Coprinopsis cinerea (strain Okayama-7 / 130 / ATCC MYA-4618 / FGSC 9003) TaxID=240176 RepID=A8NZT2_COPC7|nr:hypothetical protein CC1G_06948 [Coprinopsis cinerea okayama7\|eukprot:XP_001837742.1 hypothetical protein CC1G_06948 [Coprinopsis cinerea okayama7\